MGECGQGGMLAALTCRVSGEGSCGPGICGPVVTGVALPGNGSPRHGFTLVGPAGRPGTGAAPGRQVRANATVTSQRLGLIGGNA
jgi:hypothetical protein